MIILSIDPGFDKIGYALFEKKNPTRSEFSLITSDLIKTSKTDIHEKRLKDLYDSLKIVCETHKPDVLVMEQIFFFKNQTTVIKVAQAQGVIMVLAAQHNILVKFLTPLQIKQIITGYGASDKKSVHKMINLTLKQTIVVKDDDESDAIACGMAYCYLNENLVQ